MIIKAIARMKQPGSSSPPQNSEFSCVIEDKKTLLSDVASFVPFARLSYDMERTSLQSSEPLRISLRALGHALVAHHPAAMVKAPVYFVSFSPEKKVVLIAIKGSSTQSDWFTNLSLTPSHLNFV